MFAVIKTGGKQYRVEENTVISVEKLNGEAGDAIAFDNVLMVDDENGTKVGSPTLAGTVVQGEVVKQGRGPKIIVFKKKRRKNYRRTAGHRQDLTTVRITGIDGAQKKAAKKKAAAKPAAAKVDAPTDAPAAIEAE